MPRPRAIAVTTFAVAATGIALASPAHAAAAYTPLFQASGAGTAISLVGGVVSSAPTAPSAIRTRSTTQRSALTAATVDVPGVLHVDGASTVASTTRKVTENATVLTGHALTSGIKINGLLTLKAVSTTSTLVVRPKAVTATATTSFADLKIVGQPTINGVVGPNTTIEVPGIAKIVLNQVGAVSGTTSGMAAATAISITLLGDTVAGSTIVVNPTAAQVSLVGPGYAPLSGLAIGAQVAVSGGDSTGSVGPLGAIGMPDVGTNKQTLTNDVAGVNLGALGTVGALTTTANGAVTNQGSRSTMHAHVAGLSLLGGLITANALDSDAQVLFHGTSAPVTTASVTFTGLAVAGVQIPLDAAPGLILPLPGVGSVALRATATTDTAAAAVGLSITLSTAAFGLPAGATIQIGFAYAGLLDV